MVEKTGGAAAARKVTINDKDQVLEVENKQFHAKIANRNNSPFVSQKNSWEDEDTFPIPELLKKGIIEELKWEKPSRIQSVAIPFILKTDEDTKEHENLIAQAKNGAGKSGAFCIGSLLRVDPTIKKVQVVIIGHTRELVNQTYDVLNSIVKFDPEYKISNLLNSTDTKGAQVVVTTLGKLLQHLQGRGAVDLSELRVFVLDEADDFYMDAKKEEEINTFHGFINTKLKRAVQYIFFSATFDTAISEKISAIVSDANQINLKQEQLKLDNIQQYYMKCAKNGKLQFIKDVYESITGKTQTIIFVNSRDFAVKVFNFLKDDGYQVSLIMGGDMSKEERDKQIEKFRAGTTTVVITTDLLARGFDMPTIQLVINYDVPHKKGNPEYELYLHRIGRAGRFGIPGVAVTLFDREEDEGVFWKIIEKYQMKDKVNKLDSPALLGKVIEELPTDF
ncbi:hypothetical protein FGO68_gene461 [Halteria grandinella]|uniref:RNA helicase n=1 Tax=Halteria grandinella TaxID=5974 RepID=A0A8J8NNK1_HALGN|nr:hypothetical protein FGO68_gene461 [Halteria grandinella]